MYRYQNCEVLNDWPLKVYFGGCFFPKQFTVGVLNATLDLAALVLVGVVGFLGSEVVLSPVVSHCLPLCRGWVLVGVAAFLGSEVVLSPVVSGCLPSCGGWVLVGVAASRTTIFRNQNHRFQSKFAYCKLFGVYAGVISYISRKTYRLYRWGFLHFKVPEMIGEWQDWILRVFFWEDLRGTINGNLRVPPQCHHPQKIRPHWQSLHFWPAISSGGWIFPGVPLDSHDCTSQFQCSKNFWGSLIYLVIMPPASTLGGGFAVIRIWWKPKSWRKRQALRSRDCPGFQVFHHIHGTNGICIYLPIYFTY